MLRVDPSILPNAVGGTIKEITLINTVSVNEVKDAVRVPCVYYV